MNNLTVTKIPSVLLSEDLATRLKLDEQSYLIMIPKSMMANLNLSGGELIFDLYLEDDRVHLMGRIYPDQIFHRGQILTKYAAYCSQCYEKIRLKCPVCLKTKIPRHCKVYKNPASLWHHLKKNHGKFTLQEFDVDETLDVLNSITKAIRWGILPT